MSELTTYVIEEENGYVDTVEARSPQSAAEEYGEKVYEFQAVSFPQTVTVKVHPANNENEVKTYRVVMDTEIVVDAEEIE